MKKKNLESVKNALFTTPNLPKTIEGGQFQVLYCFKHLSDGTTIKIPDGIAYPDPPCKPC